ncbi:hypothetical protein ABZP36_010104 [Zizania latifolia]
MRRPLPLPPPARVPALASAVAVHLPRDLHPAWPRLPFPLIGETPLPPLSRATRKKAAPFHASASWYLENVTPILQRVTLVSGEYIQEVGEDTIQAGKYAVLHLRFDKMAHRTFENLKTIRPNMALLGHIFVNKSMDWLEFQQAVQAGHKGRYGQIRLRKPKQYTYTFPAPDRMCQG